MKNALTISILITATVVANAHGASLLDGVLAEETPASMPAPTEETGTNEVPADEPVKVEEQAGSADDEDVQKLREEVASLRQELDRQTSEVLAKENDRPIARKPQGHIVNPATLYIRGGGHDGGNGVLTLGANSHLCNYPLGISVRSFFLRTQKNLYTYHYSGTVEQENWGGDALCIWWPLRERNISPYAGLGIRYERADSEDDKSSIVARIGVLLNLKLVFITGEYIVGSESSELIGDISFYITRRCKLHAFVESIDLDLEKAVVGGGGLSFDF